MTLLDDTYRLLAEARKSMTLREISQGADLNFHWLGKFAQRAYAEPSVVKVERLHGYLSRRSERKSAA